MPVYTYRDTHGEVHEIVMTYSQWDREDGGTGRVFAHEGLGVPVPSGEPLERVLDADIRSARTQPPANWPVLSDAMGCHPAQINEMQKNAREAGVKTDFTRDGRPILTGPKHRKKFAEAFGYFDRNGGYGDPTRK